jgi:hypothetical protein
MISIGWWYKHQAENLKYLIGAINISEAGSKPAVALLLVSIESLSRTVPRVLGF